MQGSGGRTQDILLRGHCDALEKLTILIQVPPFLLISDVDLHFTIPLPPPTFFIFYKGSLTWQTALGEINTCNLLALDLEQLIYKNLFETQFFHLEKVTERIKLIEIMCLMHNTQDQAQIWCPLE